jgi:arylformamidase
MDTSLRHEIESLGRRLTPEMLNATTALFARLHSNPSEAARVRRDERYGPDERHRLDVFEPTDAGAAPAPGRPILMFVHGGGFVMGDKTRPGTPFYDNVGGWAAARGWIGITITYRLAPAHPWPAGAEDVGAAVGWVHEHAASLGGDAARVFLMGQSAGAVHAASYVAFPEFHGPQGRGLAGAILLSGLYDIASAARNEFQDAYFGTDPARYAARSSLDALVGGDLPLLATVAEFDGDDFQRQAARYVAASLEARGRYPRMHYLAGHNHLSGVLQLGSRIDALGPEIEDFVAAQTR